MLKIKDAILDTSNGSCLGITNQQRRERYGIKPSVDEDRKECFINNLTLLRQHEDLIIGTKEYSNITIPGLRCGFLYTGPARSLTLGELLYYYKNNIFVFDAEKDDGSNADFCCKKLYSMKFAGSPLSGCVWTDAFCPVCGKIYSLKCGGIGYLRDYRKKASFEFESSPLQIEDLVKLLKTK